MGKVVQDIWILIDTGTVVFHRVFDPTMEHQLFGILMSALNSFAKELSEGGLSNFELSNKRFNLKKRNDLIFIASSEKKTKEKKALKELEFIMEKFFEVYHDFNAKEWDGEIGMFEGFEKEIKDSLEYPIKKFWDGL